MFRRTEPDLGQSSRNDVDFLGAYALLFESDSKFDADAH